MSIVGVYVELKSGEIGIGMELRIILLLRALLVVVLLGNSVHSIPVPNEDQIVITGSDDEANKGQGSKGLIEKDSDLETAAHGGYGGYYGHHYPHYYGGYFGGGYPHYGGYGGYYGGGYHRHFGGYGGYHGGYYG